MKTVVVIILTALIGLGCGKPDRYYPDQDRLATALLNGTNWEAEAFVYVRQGQADSIDIVLIVYSPEKFLRENLSFYNIPKAVGSYKLQQTTIHNTNAVIGGRYGTYLSDGDILGERYFVVDSSDDNWIEIQSISESTGAMTGIFQVTMPIDPLRGKQFENSPDTVSFTLGEFKTK